MKGSGEGGVGWREVEGELEGRGWKEEVRGRGCDKRSSSSGENELVEIEKK